MTNYDFGAYEAVLQAAVGGVGDSIPIIAGAALLVGGGLFVLTLGWNIGKRFVRG